MLHRFHLRLYALAVIFGLVLASCLAGAQNNNRFFYRKYKPPPPTAQITVTVLRNDNDKPIANAAVIFHTLKGDKYTGDMELISNSNGKASLNLIPIGDRALLQIIANGYQTYGHIYKIDKAKMAMTIRLKLPQPEYSIYKNHNATANSGPNSGQGSGTGKAANPSKGQSAAPSKDKPSSAAKDKPSSPAKQDTQNGGGQSQAPQK